MFDLTQPLSESIPRFPGDPEVKIEALHGFPPWQISRISMGTHSGTHMDAPRHLFPDGPVLGDFKVSRFVGSGRIIDVREQRDDEPIPATVLNGIRGQTRPGWFAFFRTGWDLYWGEERYFRHPYLSPELAEELVALEPGIVGLDALSVDSTANGGSIAHATLLLAGTLIVENLRDLGKLDPLTDYTFACLPLALSDADGSPARVVAWTSD